MNAAAPETSFEVWRQWTAAANPHNDPSWHRIAAFETQEEALAWVQEERTWRQGFALFQVFSVTRQRIG